MNKKKLNRKGFTLAELLVVVAIIGVLVAVAIPVFSGQLNKAKEAVDEANIRSIRAQMAVEVLTKEADDLNGTYVVSKDGTIEKKEPASGDYTYTVDVTPGHDDVEPIINVTATAGAVDGGYSAP